MNKLFKNIGLFLAISTAAIGANAQDKIANDSTKTSAVGKSDDRNVMLNAASANAGPRNVNIGLPASVGGTTVLENDLPVVYFFWPELPYKAWRMDGMTNGVSLLDLGQTAINIGDVGFSVGTYNNLGTDKFGGNVGLNSNHYGLLNATANVSGPIKNGFKYSVGAFVNYDPGTYKVNKNNIDRYFNDQTQLYKVALTKDYKFSNGSGSFSAFYKYANSRSMTMQQYAPYKYYMDGSVKELDNFKIGSDNYIASQKFSVLDAKTGKIAERDALDDYSTQSHTIDLIGKNKFDNGLNFNYIVRLHSAKSGHFLPVMTGVDESTYTDDQGVERKTYEQNAMILASKKTPIKSLTSLFEVGKKSGKHEWKVGLNQWVYDIDKFVTEGVTYKQGVIVNPQVIEGSENYGISEYHNGTENKTALFVTDKWDVSDVITLNAGVRFEYQSLRGDFINNKDIDTTNIIPYLSNKKTDIKKDWFNKAFMISGVYKMTKNFGLLGEATYNEQAGHLENYSAGNDPNLKKSKIPGAGFGVFYNHKLFSVVSKATYIKRDEYRSTENFTNPFYNPATDPSESNMKRSLASYDIQTLGWTTDVMVSPFNGFNLHFLLTIQSPKYKNYKGEVDFADGRGLVAYDFSDKTVKGVSKVLIEIDPSYQWKGLRVWASARYFSKEYANLSNSLSFKSRWETFAGASYNINKNLEVSATFVNLLNQRGAQGTVSGTDLLTDEQVKERVGKEGVVVSGTYIRPFTAEFGLKYKF